ncbi:hypothetical protein CFC21_071385, partial [Triticum aestivum]
E